MIGAITELAKNAAVISFTCPPNQAVYGDYVEHKMQQHQNSILHKLFPKKKDTRIGLCFFDAGFGAATLAEAGISIRDSTLDCPINGEEKMCGSDIEMVSPTRALTDQSFSLPAERVARSFVRLSVE